MEDSLGNITPFIARVLLGVVVRIAVQCLVADDVVFQNGFQVLQSLFAEQETGHLVWQLLEREVGGCKEGLSGFGGVLEIMVQPSLDQS